MLLENQSFAFKLKNSVSLNEHVFRYCEFADIQFEGESVTSAFLGSSFIGCGWYWGVFNTTILIDVKFLNCTFCGTAFSGARFINCKFENCKFLKDNLDAECRFDEVGWFACSQENCTGLADLRDRDSARSHIP
ncbi:pentapeptide repeat-containing protein [Undibacterium sp. TJN19]|uniref:pentapeptide repeat-containing protein n=1 Tax=Undibacterium sp. TJN19 TaxID=3413055 RepID=UPI003BF20689